MPHRHSLAWHESQYVMPVPPEAVRRERPAFACPSMLVYPVREVGYRSKPWKVIWRPGLNEDTAAARRLRQAHAKLPQCEQTVGQGW